MSKELDKLIKTIRIIITVVAIFAGIATATAIIGTLITAIGSN